MCNSKNNIMKRFKIILLALITSFTFSCSSDDDSGNNDATPQDNIADWTGSWKASSAVFTSIENPSESIDFISEGGQMRYTMLPGSEGRTRNWIEFESSPGVWVALDEWDTQVTIGPNNTFTSTPVEVSRPVVTGTYALENNPRSITNTIENTSFDFTLTGASDTPASLVVVYVPN
jgi:hypothetical protein